MSIKISVIIPCFNDGKYIEDAFNSVQLNKFHEFIECIIVNDGSTEKFTLFKIEELLRRGAKVLHQENKGLASARNLGIIAAKGDYVLPLDSDNKIEPDVFIEAFKIMDVNSDIDIVYTNAYRFGDWSDDWIVEKFNGVKMLTGNYIDACALIRKSKLINLGLYDENMPYMGHEDWELWIRFFANNVSFYHLPKFGFHYRTRKDSMVNLVSTPYEMENRNYILKKHWYSLKEKRINSDMLLHELLELNKKLLKALSTARNFEKINRFNQSYIKENKLKSICKILLNKEFF